MFGLGLGFGLWPGGGFGLGSDLGERTGVLRLRLPGRTAGAENQEGGKKKSGEDATEVYNEHGFVIRLTGRPSTQGEPEFVMGPQEKSAGMFPVTSPSVSPA